MMICNNDQDEIWHGGADGKTDSEAFGDFV